MMSREQKAINLSELVRQLEGIDDIFYSISKEEIIYDMKAEIDLLTRKKTVLPRDYESLDYEEPDKKFKLPYWKDLD